MNNSNISAQLKNDYPELNIYIDADKRMVIAGDHKMSLLNSTPSLKTINIFSRSGRSFYQAIAQLLYSNYNVLPQAGSYASSLIILKEDLKKYKIQKLAKEWGIGFLEENGNVLAVDIDDGIERDLLLESNENFEESFNEEGSQKNQEVPPELSDPIKEEEWADLVEINFNDEIAFLEKGIEFAESMEKLENADQDEVIVEDSLKYEEKISHKGILNLINKIFGLFTSV